MRIWNRTLSYSLALLLASTCPSNLLAQAAVGQAPNRGGRCGTPDHDPTKLSTAMALPTDCGYSNTNPKSEYAPGFVFDIPVVIHVIQKSSGQGFISQTMIQSQIDVLNEDFRARAGSPGANGVDTKIQFHLATTDPSGNPTNGITYTTNNTWFNDSGNYYSTLAWDTNRYLNIYTNNASGNLGYVPDIPQGGVVGKKQDRVVLLWSSVGRNAPVGAPFHMGRTATHEVGHYLGLYHTFDGGCGSTSACYTTGDLICDTNRESSPHNGCSPSAFSCGSSDPIHNYMDYSNDICMYEFTEEQTRRMRCTLEAWRPQLGTKLNCNPLFGAGCAGSGGHIPEFTVSGCGTPGSQLTFAISRGRGGSNAFILLGTQKAAIPIPSGCTLNVSPVLPVIIGPLPLSGFGPGNGTNSLNLMVPASAPTTMFTLQTFIDDQGAPAGFSNSAGVEVAIQ